MIDYIVGVFPGRLTALVLRMYFGFCVFSLCSFATTPQIANGPGGSPPVGVMSRDTVRTGETFVYSLSYRHLSDVEVFFPDSSYSFLPFKFRKQEVFPTRTSREGSLDSAVYHLVSFEVTPQITLSLPVFIFNGKDCTAVFATPDTSFVSLLVERASLDSLELTTRLSVMPVRERLNYSAYLIASLVTVLTALLLNWIFGRKIRQQWNVFQLLRRHREFTRTFNRYFMNAKNKGSIPDVEKALIAWKNYLERLENKPFTTFTTREISDTISDSSLSEALRETDKVIYGFSAQSTDIGNSLLTLNNVAQALYLARRRAIIGSSSPG